MTEVELYRFCRLRDLGYQGMNFKQQANKAVDRCNKGLITIISAVYDWHRIMLTERRVWIHRPKKPFRITKKIYRGDRKWRRI